MSTLKVENIQHPDAEAPALVLAADGSVEIAGGGGGAGLGGEEYLFVAATGTALENGTELAAAYALAKTMTPYGEPLSATNRVTILVAPGYYDFGANTVWAVDANFVNVLSLDGARSIRIVSGSSNIGINVTADHAHLRGIDVGSNRFDGCAGPTLAGAAGLLVENCAGGDLSFGFFGTLSGTFTNCTGGNASFGTDGNASGTFANCTGGDESFGSFGTASGTFTNCTGGGASFGRSGTASGTFTNCTGGNASFGTDGTLSGFVLYCRLTDGTFPTPSSGGIIRLSLDGNFNEVNAG